MKNFGKVVFVIVLLLSIILYSCKDETLNNNDEQKPGETTNTAPSGYTRFTGGGSNSSAIQQDNRKPEFKNKCPETGREKEEYVCILDIFDADSDPVSLVFHEKTKAPAGMTIDQAHFKISWTPNENQIGEHILKLVADDGKNEGKRIYLFKLVIRPVNDRPFLLRNISNEAVYANTLYELPIPINDADSVSLSYTKVSGPLNLSIRRGIIKWRPSASEIGKNSVHITISDGKFETELKFEIYVLDPTAIGAVINLGNGVYMDKYEASVFNSPWCDQAPDKEELYQFGILEQDYPAEFPIKIGYEGEEKIKLYACSIKGVTPSRFISWYQAKKACENSGKRLCRWNELEEASKGVDIKNCKITNVPPGPVLTGAMENCKSSVDVSDPCGNIREWTFDFWCNVNSGGNQSLSDACKVLCELKNSKEKCTALNAGGYENNLNYSTGNFEDFGYRIYGNSFFAKADQYVHCHNDGHLLDFALTPDGILEDIGFRCCK